VDPSDPRAPDPARLPEVERLFSAATLPLPEGLQVETRRVASRLFLADGIPGPAPGERLGPYRVVRLLGSGGQATVVEARHEQLGRTVALKVPRSEAASRLVDEGRLAARLEHPRVVRVEDVHDEGETPYLVMEHCPGGSLEHLLERYPEGLPAAEVRRVGEALLEALAYAHAQGIVHRDVKPANVLFDARGEPKLADLGIGTPADEGGEVDHSVRLTGGSAAGDVAGTPLYMAPEQERPALLAGAPLDGRADLFAFGKLLFQLLTGASPSTVRPPSRLRPELDPAWDDLVFALLEEDRARRPADAPAALADLRAIPTRRRPPLRVSVPPAAAPAEEAPGATDADDDPRRRPARLVFGLLALLAGGLVAGLEVAFPTLGGAPGRDLLELKLGGLLAALFLAWFRRRELRAAEPASAPAAALLGLLLVGWVPLLLAFQGRVPGWYFHDLATAGCGLTALLGLVSAWSLQRPRRLDLKVRERRGRGLLGCAIVALVVPVLLALAGAAWLVYALVS